MFSWTAFLLYAYVQTITPGPNNLTSMAWGMNVGLIRALPFNAGIVVGFCIVMSLCCLFCVTLTALVPQIMFPMKILGSLYLLWLAWRIWNSVYDIDGQKVEFNKAFLSGFFLQFVNVKIILYGIVAIQVFVLPNYSDPLVLFGFAILLALIGSTNNLIWSAFGDVCARLFSNYTKIINGILAVSLVICIITLWV